MSKKKSEKFVYEVDGVEKNIILKKPTAKQKAEARIYSSQIFSGLLKTGGIVLRSYLNEHMRENGLWDDKKEEELKSLNKEIKELEKVFRKGGISKLDARKKAVELRIKRMERTILMAKTTELDDFTLEGQATNAEFDHICSACILDDEGKRVFSTVEEYCENADEEWVMKAAGKLAGLVYGLAEDWMKDLPENKFLKDYGYCDEKYNLIHPEHKFLCDEEFRRVNENGELINENGELVNAEGEVIEEKEEFVPFLD